MNPDEDVPYRASAQAAPAKRASEQDEKDFSTLVAIKKIFDESMKGLFKDFNAFDLSDKIPVDVQIAARQQAYDLLVPVQSMVDSAIESVEQKQKGE